MTKRSIAIEFEAYQSLDELSEKERECFKYADDVAEDAYAPYSNFRVGAVVLFSDQTHFVGSNQENGAYPSGMCAERVAIFAAKSAHPTKSIQSVFVVTKEGSEEPFSPCGGCRQVLIEYEQMQNEGISVYLKSGNSSIFRFNSVADLLPLAFDANKALKKK